ncbi:MAG: class I SAM-dependent methyltransferase [Luteolibacter sp.]|uniref:class I SAM-dependent methyltransferase n=1 Tax=Luteolibacter sp. TaxID=1962973 RepID=UPI003264E2F0
MGWTSEIYQSRIADPATRSRHPAGSPCAAEIECYLSACDGVDFNGTALVLGMTPELRNMALRNFKRVISVDSSRVAINMFSDWVSEELRGNETVVHGSWADPKVFQGRECSVVFGDGISANLTDYSSALATLEVIASALAPGGRFVMRNVLVCSGIVVERFQFGRLLEEFRAGEIDEAEFGFSSRMLGFHDRAYDIEREILDCSLVYEHLDRMAAEGLLTEVEAAALSRYRFMGTNYFPREESWIKLLAAAGFGAPETHPPRGKLWNEYYPIQSFSPIRD